MPRKRIKRIIGSSSKSKRTCQSMKNPRTLTVGEQKIPAFNQKLNYIGVTHVAYIQ